MTAGGISLYLYDKIHVLVNRDHGASHRTSYTRAVDHRAPGRASANATLPPWTMASGSASANERTPLRDGDVSASKKRTPCTTTAVRLVAAVVAVAGCAAGASHLAVPGAFTSSPGQPLPSQAKTPRRRSLFAGSLQELFCGRACREAYACQTSAQGLRRVVFARDGGVCALCGADGHALVERLRALAAAPHGRRVAAALRANAAWADFPRCLDRLLEKPSDGRAWEADHAVRVADGGGEALADRVQTLCVPCHKAKTKQEAKRAAAERRAAKKKPRVAAGDDDDGDCRLECVPVKTAKEFLAAVAEEEDDDDSWL